MKSNKLILAGALALGCVGVAQADCYITGSTAMRSTVWKALSTSGQVFTGAITATYYDDGVTDGSAPQNANWMVFSGTLTGGGAATVYCHWSGSEAGIADVANGTAEKFVTGASVNGMDNGTNVPVNTASHVVDLAMADNDQTFSQVYGNPAGSPPLALNTGSQVGIITFEYVRNPGLWTGTNLTDQLVRGALASGLKRAQFTGVSNQNDFVYVSGRDNGSGTRVNSFGTSGYGIFTSPGQIEIDGTSGAMQVLFNTTNSHGVVTHHYVGDFGFSSGGTLAKTMGGNTTAATDQITLGTGFSVIAYLSVGDAGTAVGKGAVVCSLDGVSFSPVAVSEGQYNFWGNEFIYQNNTLGSDSTDATTVYNNLVADIPGDCDGIKAIANSQMDCTRGGPTSDPAHN
jgi:hypothetical protein